MLPGTGTTTAMPFLQERPDRTSALSPLPSPPRLCGPPADGNILFPRQNRKKSRSYFPSRANASPRRKERSGCAFCARSIILGELSIPAISAWGKTFSAPPYCCLDRSRYRQSLPAPCLQYALPNPPPAVSVLAGTSDMALHSSLPSSRYLVSLLNSSLQMVIQKPTKPVPASGLR